MPHTQVRLLMENGRVLIEKESGEYSLGSEGLHRLIGDEILSQALQPLPDP